MRTLYAAGRHYSQNVGAAALAAVARPLGLASPGASRGTYRRAHVVRTVVGDGAAATWREDGRPLTAWEQRMRTTRTDLWLPIGGAVYRLAMGMQQHGELEAAMGTGSGMLWGSLNHVDGPDDNARQPAGNYIHALRLALIGGAQGVRDGQPFAVTPTVAASVVDALAAGPFAAIVRIVRAHLAVLGHGRPATAEEIATFSIPAGPPIIPAWALEYRS